MTAPRVLFAVSLAAAVGGCTTETYDPCAGKDEGDECSLCADDDPDCVETAVIKICSRDGECG
jgi:hypothetical protein